jgi:polar amino acid transport system substrate-binding protein
MKKLLIILMILNVLPVPVAFCENRPVLISGMVNYPPVMWDEGGKYVGIAEELARMIFDKLRIPYEFKMLPWKRAQEEAKSGAIDVITGIYWNSEREKFLAYSEPFMSDPAVLFIRQEQKFSYEKWDDLIGKKGIMNQGYSWGEGFDRFAKEKLDVVWVNNPEQAFYMLSRQDRKVDYYLYGLIPGMIVINHHNLKDKIDYIPKYITEEKFYIAFSRKSPYLELMPEVNAIIDKLVKEKYIDFLFTNYINLYQDNHTHENLEP